MPSTAADGFTEDRLFFWGSVVLIHNPLENAATPPNRVPWVIQSESPISKITQIAQTYPRKANPHQTITMATLALPRRPRVAEILTHEIAGTSPGTHRSLDTSAMSYASNVASQSGSRGSRPLGSPPLRRRSSSTSCISA